MDTDTSDTTAPSPVCVIAQPVTIPHALMPTFVGYARLEQWMETRKPEHPVYLLPIIESGPDNGGLHVDTLLVIVQQQDECGRVSYCRLRAAEMTRCFGDPFDADWQEREAAWRSMAAAVEEELKSRGLSVLPATIAAPRGLRLLEGTSDTIRFDPATKRYAKATS